MEFDNIITVFKKMIKTDCKSRNAAFWRRSENNFCKKKNPLFFILIISILSAMILTSCSGLQKTMSDQDSGYSITNSNSLSNTDSSNAFISQEEVKSGTLRLWMQPAETLNPLISTQYQWNSLSHLFYDSLYEINTNQEAVPSLVSETVISSDPLTVTIKIKGGIIFHDNTSLDSADVLATVQFIQNPANLSFYYEQMKNVIAITAIDSATIQFTLARPDPFFNYELDFPILASEKINDINILYQPGTGEYQIISYEKGVELKASIFDLNKASKENKVKSIRILELSDTRQAMEAFGEDKVDMVLLRDTFYETYYLRNDIKMIRYPSNKFIFFEMNQSLDKMLFDSAKADYMKNLLTKPSFLDGISGIFCSSNKMPFLSTSPFVHQSKCKDVLMIETPINPFANEKRVLEVVYPLNDVFKEMLILKLKSTFETEKITFNVTGYDPTEYQAILLAGKYDLALIETQLSSNPDPSWLYSKVPLRTVKGLEALNKTGTEMFSQTQTALDEKYLNQNLKIDAQEFCGIMNQAYRYGPFIGVGFRLNGVVLSKRIRGQLESNSFNQYNGVKDVWVWSGQ